VAVGDDWQAINGFAGAQLAFFNRFEDYFPGAGKTIISTNRRSSYSIVDFGNKLMRGRGVPAIAHHHSEGDIEVVEIDKIWPENESIYIEVSTSHLGDGRKNVNWDLAKALKACSDYIAQSVISDATQDLRHIPSVLVLARTSRAYRVTLEEFANKLENVLRKHPELQDLTNEFAVGKKALDLKPGFAPIEVMTAHKAKGKEAHTVIVLEATIGQFPKVHPDNLLFGLFGVTAEDVLTEERRLFYVSASRAEHRLMFLTESGKHSPYFESIIPSQVVTNNLTKRAPLSDEAQALKAHLDQVDSNFLIKHNVSQHAQRVLERLTALGKPVVGYALSQDYFAELAWPDHNPPIAILTGRHRKHSEIWRLQGWEIQ
jgi:DNA helicase-4